MRVIVTGGNGFLGRHLVAELRNRGHEVFAPSSRECDLTTLAGRRDLLYDNIHSDVVVHAAAAVGGIGANMAAPGQFFYENLIMGAELMELTRLCGIPKFVIIGTACEYGLDAPQPLKEESLWDGHPAPATAPYGLAKRALLEMGQAYRKQYGFNAIHLLPTNLYGPGDNFNPGTSHVIPALICKFAEAEDRPVALWGSGAASRDFLYVEDAARGIATALEKYDRPEPLNLGSGVETSIATVAGLIASILGSHSEIRWDHLQPEGTPRRVLDISRARELGIHPRVALPGGLRKTINWYMGKGPGLS